MKKKQSLNLKGKSLSDLIEMFINVETSNGYDCQAQLIIKNRKEDILKEKGRLMKVYCNENLPFDYMENDEMILIFEEMTELDQRKKVKS